MYPGTERTGGEVSREENKNNSKNHTLIVNLFLMLIIIINNLDWACKGHVSVQIHMTLYAKMAIPDL